MKESDVTARVRPILHDLNGVRWPDSELWLYMADAQHQIVEVKPTATATTESYELTPGTTEQDIPAGASKVLRIKRNLGRDGTDRGRAIVLSSLATLDAMDSQWHRKDGREIELWAYDPDGDRDVFYVYPAPNDTLFVEISYAKLPNTPIAADSDLDLDDRYINPVVDWVLYRAFSKDSEYGGNNARAMGHFDAFAAALGVKREAMRRTDPNLTRRGGDTNGKV